VALLGRPLTVHHLDDIPTPDHESSQPRTMRRSGDVREALRSRASGRARGGRRDRRQGRCRTGSVPGGLAFPDGRPQGLHVSCVAHAAEDFVAEDLITEAEKGATLSEAGAPSCGHKK
jgi:hypothetical protein